MRSIFMVFSNPTPGNENAYNEWYDNQHLGDLLRIPGVVGARRYEWGKAQLNATDRAPAKYLSVYEIEAEDPGAVLAEIAARSGTDQMPLSDAIDLGGVTTMSFSAITALHSKEHS